MSSVESYLDENFTPITSGQWNSCAADSVTGGFSPPAGSNESCVTVNSASTVVNVALHPQAVHYAFGGRAVWRAPPSHHPRQPPRRGTDACLLRLLGISGTTLALNGNGNFKVSNNSSSASFAVDSSAAPASITGSGTVETNHTGSAQINVVGGTTVTGSGSFQPAPHKGTERAPDPLELDPPHRLVATFVYEGAPDREAIDSLDLEEIGAETMLHGRRVHDSIASRDAHVAAGMEEGMTDAHHRLNELLDSVAAKGSR